MTAMTIWHRASRKAATEVERLGALTAAQGGRAALAAWAPTAPDWKTAYVYGGRDDLWWEFTLNASFRWQAHLYRLRPEVYRARVHRLTQAFGLGGLMQTLVEDLTPAQRALADLAVALLPGPELLLWEEPFCQMDSLSAARAAHLVRELHLAEGLVVVAVADEAPGLGSLSGAASTQLHAVR